MWEEGSTFSSWFLRTVYTHSPECTVLYKTFEIRNWTFGCIAALLSLSNVSLSLGKMANFFTPLRLSVSIGASFFYSIYI